MPEDSRNEEQEPADGNVLPQREVMSLISTDPVPVDPVYAGIVPAGEAEGPPLGRLPVEPITEGGSDS